MAIYGNVGFSASGLFFAPQKYAIRIVLPVEETVRAIWGRTGNGADAVGFIYAAAGGGPGALIAQTAGVAAAHPGIMRLPFAAPVTLPAGTYWIGIHPGSASSGGVVFSSGAVAADCALSDDALPIDAAWVPGSATTNRMSVWLDTEAEPYQAEVGAKPASFAGLLGGANSANRSHVYRIWVKKRQRFGALFLASRTTIPTAKVRAVIYSHQPGVGPQTLVAQGSEVVGLPAAAWVRLPFAAPVILDPGAYWIGVHSDTQIDTYYAMPSTSGVDRSTLASPFQGVLVFNEMADSYADGASANYGGVLEWSTYAQPVMYLGEGEVVPGPAIQSVAPPSGVGGTQVTITGAGFTGATAVTFGGVAATGVVVVSDAQITCVAPAHALGFVDVTVTVGPDSSTLAGAFQYLDPTFQVTSVTPTAVHTSGGQVQIDGAGFDDGTDVLIDGVNAPTTLLSATRLLAQAQPHAAGAVQLVVRKSNGDARTAAFAYEAAALAAVAPASARPGDQVTLTGQWFFEGAQGSIGGVAAQTTRISSTELRAVVPALAPGVYDVEVENVAPGYAETLALAAALEVLEPVAALSGGPVIMYVVS